MLEPVQGEGGIRVADLEYLKQVLKPLDYDFVFIDTPPSICWLTESALIAANNSLICATPEFYSVKGLQRLAVFMNNISERHHLSVLGITLSFWYPRGKSNEEFNVKGYQKTDRQVLEQNSR